MKAAVTPRIALFLPALLLTSGTGVGDGNATQPMIDALAAAAKKGVVVVRSSRVGSGTVARNVELDDDKLGFVAALELNPQKARVLLQQALTRTKDTAAIQEYFEEY